MYAKTNGLQYKEFIDARNKKTEFSFMHLEYMYEMHNGGFYVYTEMFKNDEPYRTKCRNNKPEDIAKVAYDSYNEYLESVFDLITEGEGAITSNNRAFVVKCLILWKMECTYRFRLTVKLAKYLFDKQINYKDIISGTIVFIISAHVHNVRMKSIELFPAIF